MKSVVLSAMLLALSLGLAVLGGDSLARAGGPFPFRLLVPGVAMDGWLDSTAKPVSRDIAIEKVGVVSADGQTITYTINFTGSNPIDPIHEGHLGELTIVCPLTITDTLPPGATLVSYSGPWTRTGSSYVLDWCSTNSTLTIPVASFPPPPLTIVVNVPPGQVVTNCVTIFDSAPIINNVLWDESNVANNTFCTTNTTPAGSMFVKATLDGTPWIGPVSFTISGPQTITGTSVPLASTATFALGAYALSYVSGGPPGATLLSTTPSATQTLTAGGGITYTLNFRTKPAALGTIVVNATRTDAAGVHPWTGPVSFTLTGPQTFTGTTAPQTFSNVPVGTYTLTYMSGGPPGATLLGVTPSATQTLTTGGTVTFTAGFR